MSPPASEKPFSIAIVGGGIGGLSTAIALRHRNISITIYESAPAFAEIGAGVGLGPNAAQAMKLIDPRMYAGFRKCGTNNAWEDRQNFWFSFRRGDAEAAKGLAEDDAEIKSAGKTGTRFCDLWCETGQTSVHRARFLDELIALVPKEVARFGKRLTDIDDNGDHVVLHFADGTSAKHSAVIGCDGIKSRTRQIVLGKDHPAAYPQFTGKYAYRGLIPMDKAAKLLGDELARNSQMYLGKGGHILTFPIEHGATMNVVAFQTKKDGKWDDPLWVKPMDKDAMHRDFEGWVSATSEIVSLMEHPDIWALFDHPPAPTYYKSRICLLGDSAHASTPHQGAGAGMAIEDALILSSVLALVNDEKDISRAFAVYDALQRPRSQKLVTTSREGGLLYDLQLPGVEEDMPKIRELLSHRMKWLWEVDLQARAEEARKRFTGASKI
ncbi:hypothetical protein AAFC00_006587 [Neodothiora populina]